MGIYLVYAMRLVYLAHVIVGVSHGYYSAVTHEYGQLPQRGVEVVNHALALVHVAGEIVYPLTFGQIYAVAYVTAVLIGRCGAIYGGHEEPRAVHILIAGGPSQGVTVGGIEEHGPYHGQTVHRLGCYAVGVRHKLRLELEIHAVDGCGRLAEGMGVFLVIAPSVHVELHGGPCLPLEVAGVYHRVLPAEYAVHVGGDVGLPG